MLRNITGLSTALQTTRSLTRTLTLNYTSTRMAAAPSDRFPPPSLRQAAEEVANLLKTRQETVAVAETAAGGLISSSLLSTPGASKIYKGGLTLYTLESRVQFAGWTQADIDQYRGPTPAIVAGLAQNVRQKLGATYCVSESGTAGPTGGNTPNRTPGYVALAVSSEADTKAIDLDTGKGTDREQNMLAFAIAALNMLRDYIQQQQQQTKM